MYSFITSMPLTLFVVSVVVGYLVMLWQPWKGFVVYSDDEFMPGVLVCAALFGVSVLLLALIIDKEEPGNIALYGGLLAVGLFATYKALRAITAAGYLHLLVLLFQNVVVILGIFLCLGLLGHMMFSEFLHAIDVR